MSDERILISVRELGEHLADTDLRIVDCRFSLLEPEKGFSDYLAGHIPGAVYANLDHDLAAPRSAATGRHPLPDTGAFAGTLSRWGIGAETRVVVYDGGGGAIAARLWWLLGWVGHDRVRLLDGGFRAWQQAGMAVSTEQPTLAAGHRPVHPDPALVISTEALQQALNGEKPPVVLDARSASRFRGESEPIDPVAGHIPGTRNLPCELSLRADGTWRSPQELAGMWREALGGGMETPWIAMCGSGVTACHLALSARLAGAPAPVLYAGSFSEWIRDPARPVATGPAAGPA